MNNWVSLVIVLGICGIIGFITTAKSVSDLTPVYITNPNSLINFTGAIINLTTLNYTNVYNITNNITTPESDPYWWGNYTNLNATWNTTYNSSYALNSTLSAYDSKLSSFTELNTPYYTNPLGYRNDTNAYNSSYLTNETYYFSNPLNYKNITYNSSYEYQFNTTLQNMQLMNNATLQQWLYNQTTPAINYADSLLITTFFNASDILGVRGTVVGTLGNITSYDTKSVNVTEEAGATGLDFRVNFTSITEFNQLVVRYKSSASESHTMIIAIYDYVLNSWESYATVGASVDWNVFTLGVFDSSDHVNGDGNVSVRFYITANGNTGHVHYFDWVTISTGPATPNSVETDPYSIHLDNTSWVYDFTNPLYINMTNTSWIYPLTNALYYNMTNNTFNYMTNTSLQTIQNQTWVTAITNPYYMNMSNQSITANNSLYLNGYPSTYYVNSTNNTFAKNSTLATYDACMFNTFNSTYNTFVVNNVSARIDFVANITERNLFLAVYNASYMTNTFNSTYDAKPSNTFNTTYNTWSLLNQTLPAITYANEKFYNMTNNTFNYMINTTINNLITNALINNTGINATTLNATKVVSKLFCFTETCNSNITWNGTHSIWY